MKKKRDPRLLHGVRYIRRSGNGKIGKGVDAVYIAISQSCHDCPFKPVDGVKKGCWGTVERVGMLNQRLEVEAEGMDRRALGREVARAIEASYAKAVPEGRRMRLPVSGDLATESAVRPVARAVSRWLDRGGAGVWGYTHGWRRVRRSSWGRVSVLASVESAREVAEASARGYAVARVVEDFPLGPRAWFEEIEGVVYRHIPCPEQTLNVKCSECELCFDDARLKERNAVVAFRVHSQIKKRALAVLQEKNP